VLVLGNYLALPDHTMDGPCAERARRWDNDSDSWPPLPARRGDSLADATGDSYKTLAHRPELTRNTLFFAACISWRRRRRLGTRAAGICLT